MVTVKTWYDDFKLLYLTSSQAASALKLRREYLHWAHWQTSPWWTRKFINSPTSNHYLLLNNIRSRQWRIQEGEGGKDPLSFWVYVYNYINMCIILLVYSYVHVCVIIYRYWCIIVTLRIRVLLYCIEGLYIVKWNINSQANQGRAIPYLIWDLSRELIRAKVTVFQHTLSLYALENSFQIISFAED